MTTPIEKLSNELADHRREDRENFDQAQAVDHRVEFKVDALQSDLNAMKGEMNLMRADVAALLAALNMGKGVNFIFRLGLLIIGALAAAAGAYRAFVR